MNDGGPAFPRVAFEIESEVRNDTIFGSGFSGMSLRDWFAGQAMVGLLSANSVSFGMDEFRQQAARISYGLADAMLAERAKQS